MPTARRLFFALLASLLLHLALLLSPSLSPPLLSEAPPPRPLTARLEPRPPAPPPRPAPPREATPQAFSRPAPPAPAGPLPAPAPLSFPEAPGPAAPEPEIAPPPEAPPAASEAAPPAEVRALPVRLAVSYTLFKGSQGLAVGSLTHQWESTDGQYTLTSTARATGIFSLFVPGTLIQVSRGTVGPAGLRPLHFWIQRGQSGNRTESATFDWGTGILRFGRAGEERTAPLIEGSQDVLSVLYQLALTAPHAGVLELAVTNGRKFDRYRYRVVDEETLDTPLGPLVTEHLERVREGNEDGLELWLARDHHYLPVKIRFTDRRGEVAEQLVDEIRAE